MTRRGFTILEIIIAAALLALLLTIGFSAWVQSRRLIRLNEHRNAARQVVILALERVRSMPSDALPKPGETRDFGIPAALQQDLPGGRCDVVVTAGNDPDLKLVRVSVTWKDARTGESGEALVRVKEGEANK